MACCAYRWLNACQLADEFTYLGSAIAVRRKCRRLFAYMLCSSSYVLYLVPHLEKTEEANFCLKRVIKQLPFYPGNFAEVNS